MSPQGYVTHEPVAIIVAASGLSLLRCWRNTVEPVLFDISSSMKPYPSAFQVYTSNLRLS